MNGDNRTVKEIAEHIISQRDLFLRLFSPRESVQSTIDWWEDVDKQEVADSLGVKLEQLNQWAIVNEMIENFLSQK